MRQSPPSRPAARRAAPRGARSARSSQPPIRMAGSARERDRNPARGLAAAGEACRARIAVSLAAPRPPRAGRSRRRTSSRSISSRATTGPRATDAGISGGDPGQARQRRRAGSAIAAPSPRGACAARSSIRVSVRTSRAPDRTPAPRGPPAREHRALTGAAAVGRPDSVPPTLRQIRLDPLAARAAATRSAGDRRAHRILQRRREPGPASLERRDLAGRRPLRPSPSGRRCARARRPTACVRWTCSASTPRACSRCSGRWSPGPSERRTAAAAPQIARNAVLRKLAPALDRLESPAAPARPAIRPGAPNRTDTGAGAAAGQPQPRRERRAARRLAALVHDEREHPMAVLERRSTRTPRPAATASTSRGRRASSSSADDEQHDAERDRVDELGERARRRSRVSHSRKASRPPSPSAGASTASGASSR